jgi:hypothetical protein
VIDQEHDLRLTIAKSERAHALLSDSLLVEAFGRLESRWLKAWRNSPARDAEGREEIWRLLKTLTALQDELNTVLQDGTVARHKLEELRSGQVTNPL